VIEQTLAETGLPPHRLELEITERIFMENTENTLATLGRIKGLGVRIALDDFGTGYSSLSYLRSFPLPTRSRWTGRSCRICRSATSTSSSSRRWSASPARSA